MGLAASRAVAGKDLGCDSNWNASKFQGLDNRRDRILRANSLIKNCLARFYIPAHMIKKDGRRGPLAGQCGLLARPHDAKATNEGGSDHGRTPDQPIGETRSRCQHDLIVVQDREAGRSNKPTKTGAVATNPVPGSASVGRS